MESAPLLTLFSVLLVISLRTVSYYFLSVAILAQAKSRDCIFGTLPGDDDDGSFRIRCVFCCGFCLPWSVNISSTSLELCAITHLLEWVADFLPLSISLPRPVRPPGPSPFPPPSSHSRLTTSEHYLAMRACRPWVTLLALTRVRPFCLFLTSSSRSSFYFSLFPGVEAVRLKNAKVRKIDTKPSANPDHKNSPLHKVKVLAHVPPGAITQPELSQMKPPGIHFIQ